MLSTSTGFTSCFRERSLLLTKAPFTPQFGFVERHQHHSARAGVERCVVMSAALAPCEAAVAAEGRRAGLHADAVVRIPQVDHLACLRAERERPRRSDGKVATH